MAAVPPSLLYAYEDLLGVLVSRSAELATPGKGETDVYPWLVCLDGNDLVRVDLFEFAAKQLEEFGRRWDDGLISSTRFADRDYAEASCRREERAATLLQSGFRGHACRQQRRAQRVREEAERDRRRRENEETQACVIQRGVRIKRAHNEVTRRRRKKKEHAAACRVQSGVRGRRGRLEAKRRRDQVRAVAAAEVDSSKDEAPVSDAANELAEAVAKERAAVVETSSAQGAAPKETSSAQGAAPPELPQQTQKNLERLADEVAQSRRDAIEAAVQSLTLGIRLSASEGDTVDEESMQGLRRTYKVLKEACAAAGCEVPVVPGLRERFRAAGWEEAIV